MKARALACAAALLGLAACDDRAPAAAASTAPPVASAVAPVAASAIAGDQAVAPAGHADRVAPPDVPPVVRDGVSYAQADDGRKAGLGQHDGALVASDAASGKPLWAIAVYPSDIDPKQETDAQWVFFKSMAFDPDGRLRIVNEAGKAFLVDVKTRAVTPAP
jgi:hypothetical protein